MLTILGMIQFPALILAIVGVFGISPKIKENLEKNHYQQSSLINGMAVVSDKTVSICRDIQSGFSSKTKRARPFKRSQIEKLKEGITNLLSLVIVCLLLLLVISTILKWIF